jgi:hypothetical protein
MFLDAQRVIAINTFVDEIHAYFPYLSVIAILILLESFLPPRQGFWNWFDEYTAYIRFGFLILFSLIALSQGFLGGCFIHLPQNYLAQVYLGRDWVPYGIFYREYIPQNWVIWLRVFYLFGSLLVTFQTWKFWKNRLRAGYVS